MTFEELFKNLSNPDELIVRAHWTARAESWVPQSDCPDDYEDRVLFEGRGGTNVFDSLIGTFGVLPVQCWRVGIAGDGAGLVLDVYLY